MFSINPKFKDLIPPLSLEELNQLEENLTKEGCRDPLVIWKEGDFLLDGHNRYSICQRLNLSFKTIEISLETEEDAENWIDKNQLGRRNLSPDTMSLIRGRIYNRRKKQGTRTDLTLGKSCTKLNTAERVAKEHGVSERTIKNDGKFADAVEKIKPEVPDIVERINTGNVSSRNDVIEASKNPELIIEKITPHVSHNSGENEWYTPFEYIEAARRVLGEIDIDPTSCELANKNIKAKVYYTKDNSGLDKKWQGRLWMNPPYSGNLVGKFIHKYSEHCLSKEITSGIVLVNNATETAWFKELIDSSTAIVFPTGRIKYLDSTGKPANTPLQGQAFLYWGNETESFLKEFEHFGWGAIIR